MFYHNQVMDISGLERDGHAGLCARQKALGIERECCKAKTRDTGVEARCPLNLVAPCDAGPESSANGSAATGISEIAAVTSATPPATKSKDRVYGRYLPGDLSCVSNVAISIVNYERRFQILPRTARKPGSDKTCEVPSPTAIPC